MKTKQEAKSAEFPSVCRLALENNLIDKQQLIQALSDFAQRKKDMPDAAFEDYLVERQLISKSKMDFLIKMRSYRRVHTRDKTYAQLLEQRGLVKHSQIKKAFAIQTNLFKERKKVVSIADILLKSGLITSEQDKIVFHDLKKLNKGNKASPSSETASPEETRPLKNKKFNDDPEAGKSICSSPGGDRDCNDMAVGDQQTAAEKLRLMISDDALEAFVLNKMSPSETMTVDEVKAFLSARGITYGIVDDSLIRGFLTSPVFRKKAFKIASGVAPDYGRDAVLTYHFEHAYLKSGTLTAEGKIDFRERGKAPFVNLDDLLLEKVPARQGAAGTNIYGEVLQIPEVRDIRIFPGPGTRLAQDGLRLYAATSGQPFATPGNKVSVFAEMIIDGDVGFKTGHVEFDGNVVVRGSVKDGFRVSAADLTAVDITGGEIDLTGNAVISGIITNSRVSAKGNVAAAAIRKSKIFAGGSVVIKKLIIDSEIENSGACIVAQGRIVSSKVTSRMGIKAANVGTDVSEPCKLCAGVDKYIAREIKGFDDGIVRCEEKLTAWQEQLKRLEGEDHEIQQETTVQAHVQDRSTLAQKNLKNELARLRGDNADQGALVEVQKEIARLQLKAKDAEQNIEALFDRQKMLENKIQETSDYILSLTNEIEALKAEKDAVIEWSHKEKGLAIIEASGLVQAGTALSGMHARTVLRETVRRVNIREVRITDPDSPVKWEMRIQH